HTAGDKAGNLAAMGGMAEEAKRQGVEILVFAECCITAYWHLRKVSTDDLRALAEPVFDGPSSHTLGKWPQELQMTIGAGSAERASDGAMFNSYVVAMPDGLLVRHRKIQAFEHDSISSGDSYTVFDTPHGCKVGVLICYDKNIFENVLCTALLGAQ